MGLAVLPSRLKGELATLEEAILNGTDITAHEVLSKHAPWVAELKNRHTFNKENTADILKEEVGQVFAKVLEHAGVYKRTESGKKAFLRFIDAVNHGHGWLFTLLGGFWYKKRGTSMVQQENRTLYRPPGGKHKKRALNLSKNKLGALFLCVRQFTRILFIKTAVSVSYDIFARYP